MKEIRAYVRPERLDAVLRALKLANVPGMMVSDVLAIDKACDPERGRVSLELPHLHTQAARIEILCGEGEVEAFVRLIQKEGCTRHEGDGVVVVCDAGRVVSIHHPEREADDSNRSPEAI